MEKPMNDPEDGMPTRSYLAMECLAYRMRQICETFYEAEWIEDLEFEVWDMAHQRPHRIAGHKVTDGTAKFFRDLSILAGGWWAWPEPEEGSEDRGTESFFETKEWERMLRQRTERSEAAGTPPKRQTTD